MSRGLGRIAVVALVAFGAFGTSTLGAGMAIAFDELWLPAGCSGVAPGESGLWDDSASGGPPGNEAAYAWVLTNAPVNEQCRWVSPNVNVDTNAFPQLVTRVAVNDEALFRLEARSGSNFCQGGVVLGAITIGGAMDHSAYITATIMMAAGIVNEICITLTDDPNNSLDTRSNALLDEIAIPNSGWKETFTGDDGDGD